MVDYFTLRRQSSFDRQVKDTDIARELTPLKSPNTAYLPPRLLTVIPEESTQYHERNLQTGFKIRSANVIVALTASGFSVYYRHCRLTIIPIINSSYHFNNPAADIVSLT